MDLLKLASEEVAEFISTKTRQLIRTNYPFLWKLMIEEFDEFKQCSGFALFSNEIINIGKYVILPSFVGLVCNCFDIVPFALTWLSVILMVHYMTKDMHENEYHESVVSPKLLIRCSADLLIGLLGFYFHEAPIIPNNEGNILISIHVKAWGSLIFSCFATACEDFGFYRLYIALMKGIAVTYRILNPDVSTSFVTGGNGDPVSEKMGNTDFDSERQNEVNDKKTR
ncbi:unnamed protein product [Orchesella dallaii]|uniref:Uncharacterized protein n=1 Tax=Orchesella dallaii TaxID=48710 RepID=A0ABP1S5T0_9HEXA